MPFPAEGFASPAGTRCQRDRLRDSLWIKSRMIWHLDDARIVDSSLLNVVVNRDSDLLGP